VLHPKSQSLSIEAKDKNPVDNLLFMAFFGGYLPF
jgi:hypothetical protein